MPIGNILEKSAAVNDRKEDVLISIFPMPVPKTRLSSVLLSIYKLANGYESI